jgi:peptidoglycan-associated lipoprotein
MEAYFMYDSSTLGSKVQPSLDKIAKCFIDGPLAGRQIALVGHADPRGDDDYNMLLGERRAQTVDRALVSRNLASSRISTTSRGEMDAIGTDETSWALDRKVQMELAE